MGLRLPVRPMIETLVVVVAVDCGGGSGFGVWGLGFGVWGLGSGFWVLEIWGFGF